MTRELSNDIRAWTLPGDEREKYAGAGQRELAHRRRRSRNSSILDVPPGVTAPGTAHTWGFWNGSVRPQGNGSRQCPGAARMRGRSCKPDGLVSRFVAEMRSGRTASAQPTGTTWGRRLADADGWLPGRRPKLCVFCLRRRPPRTNCNDARRSRPYRTDRGLPPGAFRTIANCSSRGWGRGRRCCAQPARG
jgi:hypothetical protein